MNEPARKFGVLVVDDSAVSRELLTRVLESDPAIQVVGCAKNALEAIAMIGQLKPDVVTMDIHMPGMDGFEATRQIMQSQPLPIVIVSVSFDPKDVAKLFRALEVGAVAAVEKPPGFGDPASAVHVRRLIDTVKAMAEVRVVRRWTRDRIEARKTAVIIPKSKAEIRVLAIGASTGGPPVLQTVLQGLPKPCPVPVLVVQHISAGFVQGLADWLGTTTGMPIHIAQHGQIAEPGAVYIAPDGLHMRLRGDRRIACTAEPAEYGLRPAVSCLFRSMAENFGAHAVGVLLTGMGRDGAIELKAMHDTGAITFAQDKESSIVHGMPGEAIRLEAATHTGPPAQIASMLHALFTRQEPTSPP